jgi:hypothetical protein
MQCASHMQIRIVECWVCGEQNCKRTWGGPDQTVHWGAGRCDRDTPQWNKGHIRHLPQSNMHLVKYFKCPCGCGSPVWTKDGIDSKKRSWRGVNWTCKSWRTNLTRGQKFRDKYGYFAKRGINRRGAMYWTNMYFSWAPCVKEETLSICQKNVAC